jgi:hypothetical protein
MSTPTLRRRQRGVTSTAYSLFVVLKDVLVQCLLDLCQSVVHVFFQSLYSLLVADPVVRLSAYFFEVFETSSKKSLFRVFLLISQLRTSAVV